ncbi:MAG: PilZ domain-containing protein [Myxococcales bacterium]|nr:PilZ domain-containing protein [Myxococcales bacterium]
MMEARSPDRRRTPRYSLEQPARLEVRSWAALVELYTRDICHDGVFIQTTSPPPLHTLLAVHLLLPDGTGTIRFRGKVVHVIEAEASAAASAAAGFGVQFLDLTAEDRGVLRQIVAQAQAAADTPHAIAPAVHRVMSQQLARRAPRPEAAGTPRRQRRRTPMDPTAVRSDGVVPEPSRPPAPRPRSGPSPRGEHRRLLARALELTRSKRYEEALGLLSRAHDLRPEHIETQVLQSLVAARQAVAARDLERAKACYEDVLRLEPSNSVAHKDLLILSALGSSQVQAAARR